MPSPIVKGSAGPNSKPLEVYFDPRRGISFHRRYTAPNGDGALLGLESEAQALGYATRKIVNPGGLSELEISSPESESGSGNLIVTDQWQLIGNEITKSIYEHPKALALAADHSGAIGYIKKQVRNYEERDSTDDFTFDGSDFGGHSANASAIFNLAVRDQLSYLVAQYVLRHTTNCSAGYAANVSDAGVFKVYTTTQLLSEAQSSSLWVQPLAGRLVSKIGAITEPDPIVGYQWGWLKKPATEQTTPDNRIEITQEYWLEQWSNFNYEPL